MSFGTAPFGDLIFGGASGVSFATPSSITNLLSGEIEAIEDLIIVEPYNPHTDAREAIYIGDGWASRPGARLPTGESLPNQYFLELLVKAPNREKRVLDGGQVSTSSVPSYGDVLLSDADHEFIPRWLRLAWEGAPFRYLQGATYWDLESFATVFKGEVARFAATNSEANLQLRDVIQKLQKPIEDATYLGLGACLRGNGTDGRLAFGDVLDITGDFSFRFRIWPDSNANSSSRLWNKDDGATGWLSYLVNQNLTWLVRGGATATTTGNPIVAGKWNEAWITYDATADSLFFAVMYDDDPESFVTQTVTYTTTPTNVAHSLTFGASAAGANAFAGRWDELAIFNRAVTSEEMKAWRGKELLGDENGLMGLWHLNEGDPLITTAFDALETNNGTLAGTVEWTGSLTGTKGVAGKVRLGGAGIILKREPVLIDELNLVYEVAFGGMVGVMDDGAGLLLEDRGLRPFVYDGDNSDPYAADPAVGHWISINSQGWIRLGSKPSGTLLVTAQITAETDAGSVIEFLALKALEESEINAATLGLLTSKNAAPISIPWGLESSTIDSHIVLAASSVGAWRTTDLQGRLAVGRLEEAETPTVDLRGDGSREDDITIDGIQPVYSEPAARAVEIRFAPYETTLSATDLHPDATLREKEDWAQPFRSFRTPENAIAKRSFNAAPLIVRETRLVYEIDARNEAERENTLRREPHRVDRVDLMRSRHDLQPGVVANIAAPMLDYVAGRSAVVVGASNDDASRRHSIEVRVAVAPLYIIADDGEYLVTDDGEFIAT